MSIEVTPFSLEIFRNVLSGLAEEMGASLARTAVSPNIKERKDFSCALFDAKGRLWAQASHIPVHLGSMPALIEYVLAHHTMRPGDVWLANDPYRGGTHLPDITVMSPLYVEGRLFCVLANRAHHSDIGGSAPGSMPLSSDIHEEGLIIPPIPFVRKGKRIEAVWDLLLANVRTPIERAGDFEAQLAANLAGQRRMLETLARYGQATVEAHGDALLKYSETLMREALRKLPQGTFVGEDVLDGDGRIPIRATLRIQDGTVECDFAGTAPLQKNCLNAPASVAHAAVYYVFRCLAGDHIPPNSGCFAPIRLVIPDDCMLKARAPFSVAGGNVETSQRIVDVLLKALAEAAPDLIPAASMGTMNNFSFGGWDSRHNRPFTYYETIGGGCGAAQGVDGCSAVQTHMTNTQNTPTEALEMELPLRVKHYGVRRGSGGQGRFRGGDGIDRSIQFLAPARVSILSERREVSPYGLQGGQPGATGQNLKNDEVLPGQVEFEVAAGDIVTIRTPGGGGWGIPD